MGFFNPYFYFKGGGCGQQWLILIFIYFSYLFNICLLLKTITYNISIAKNRIRSWLQFIKFFPHNFFYKKIRFSTIY